MVTGRVIKSEFLRRLIGGNYITHKIGIRLGAEYRKIKERRQFHSRIKGINPDEYFDTSCRPNLNVIIITVDSLRNSHLSCQGHFRETTPFLDSIESRFTAISAAPWTYPSVASILTGLYPHNHNAVAGGATKHVKDFEKYERLRRDILTLPEIFYLLGYRIYFGTAIEMACLPVRSRVVPERYNETTRADALFEGLTRWISKKKKEGFFAYVHLADLHMPWNPPDNFKNFFGTVKALPKIDMRNGWKSKDSRSPNEDLRERIENYELLYDNIIRYVDSAIEQLFYFLEDAGLADNTIVVVTGDHGEEFLEHAELEACNFYDPRGFYGIGHGHNVFNVNIEVPLLIHNPVATKRSSHFVSTVDIMPTLLDLIGVNHRIKFDGRNIFSDSVEDRERPLLSEACGYGYEKKALVVGRYKLIYSKNDGIEWVFDLEKDPEEQRPIVDEAITSVFVAKLLQILKEDERRKIREISRNRSL